MKDWVMLITFFAVLFREIGKINLSIYSSINMHLSIYFHLYIHQYKYILKEFLSQL